MKNDKNLRISVITCTYNSENFLMQALDSIECQSYLNIEHIINDSYSTDGTLEIVHDYVERNKGRYPIKLVQSDPHGVGNALNFATQEATGDIIHYLHSDDYYLNRYSLEKVVNYFNKNPDLVWLTGNFLIEYKGHKITIPQTFLLQSNMEIALSCMNFISHENTFMRTEAVQGYGGFNETKQDVVEYSLWLHLMRDHKPLIVDDEFTVFIIHKGSTSTGSLYKFSKALMRAFHTQRKEKVLPLVGNVTEKQSYKQLMMLIKRFNRWTSSLGIRVL
jgi:glycosyltransferase involved in cell wall biosynthesis